MTLRTPFLFVPLIFFTFIADAQDANRLAYLDFQNPFHPSREFPKLTTPQWIGEPGVDAAIILSIDDMRELAKYEEYLRPIINKLKENYGTAPMSIMACGATPDDPRLQTWLKEGVSIETHTVTHPCPLLAQGNFDAAKNTFEACVALIGAITGNKPVAFRMPCCDSINSTSPRFFSEIFNKPEPGSPFLTIDSSVFNITTANDPDLPREWVLLPDGRERFRSYLPFKSFVTTIEDYPYPYQLNGSCWEFPCAVPSDWEAQNINKPNSPVSLADMKVSLDAAVAKKGVYTLVYHPHGWIESAQIVELVEHAISTYGKRVKFLSFRDANDRINKNLLLGESLRSETGADTGTRLADLDADGYMDVLRLNKPNAAPQTRLWLPDENRWLDIPFPAIGGDALQFGIDSGDVVAITRSERAEGAWRFSGNKWNADASLLAGLQLNRKPILTSADGVDQGVRLRDVDGDGISELLVLNESVRAVFVRASSGKRWKPAAFDCPDDAIATDLEGRDAGLRFVDLDDDGDLDLVVSNEQRYGVHLFGSLDEGWNQTVTQAQRDATNPGQGIPAITVNGENNGAWFHSRHLWFQNEHTDKLPDLVDRRSFDDLLADSKPEPKSPQRGLSSLRMHPGLRAQLVASEPQVQDPVAISWGADGKLWVVEMRDYPLGLDGEGKPGSRIKYLEDLNADGHYEKATLFLDKLSYATGVFPWRDGVIVTAAPLVFFARDTNGDGEADEIRTLFTGFGEVNQQHRVNGLRWGLDNWLHGANGDGNGAIVSEKSGEIVDISGRDFRINPDTGVIDPESGQTQFGIAFDDWGSRFGCANWLPVWHFAIDDAPMRRNPHFSPGNPREYIVEQAQLYPSSRTLTRFNDFEHVNRSTSTCGLEIYRDVLLGSAYEGDVFVCEPVHNLVLRSALAPSGFTFTAKRAPGEEQSEFLSSTDNWFRPVMVRTGPDGAMYVVDMYREVIEHPEYISKETQATLNLRAGDDRGRIYRILPVHESARAVPMLANATPAELVAALESPNGALRDMAHQLLIERADVSAIPLLAALLRNAHTAQARLHALCALDGLSAITAQDLLTGLNDLSPGVRQHAVRIAATSAMETPEIISRIIALSTDENAFVRKEVIYALPQLASNEAVTAFSKIIGADGNDPYAGMALLSSLNASNVNALVPALVNWSNTGAETPARDQVYPAIVGIAMAANDQKTLLALAVESTKQGSESNDSSTFARLAKFLDAMQTKGASLDSLGSDDLAGQTRQRISEILDRARNVARSETDDALRASAVSLLAREAEHFENDVATLAMLIATPGSASPVALDRLISTGDARVPSAVIAAWPAMQQELRNSAMDNLLKRGTWINTLLAALENGVPSVRELDADQRQRLLNSEDPEIRARAEKLMASVINADRQAVLDQFAAAATTPGQFLRGRHIFRERCASCHKMGEDGHAVGPDLGAITDRSPQSLLVSILDPNRAVETKYFDFRVETTDLRTINGIVAKESGNSVTLISANGIETELLRSEIETMESTSRSPMPDGLEDGLSVEDMANLIAFILDIKPAN